MSNTLTPNMSLIIPGVGTEAGPTYATDVNNSLTIVDAHDHTQGSGVLITPLAMNINTNLTFNNQLALNVQALNLTLQTTDAASRSLYVKNGGEASPGPYADLWYNDGVNPPIQITSAGIVNVTASAIPGESYAAGTFSWRQTQDSLPTTPANFDIGGITIRPTTAGTTNGVMLVPPGSISSQYTLVLPVLPPVQSFMTLDNSGNITAPWVVDNSTIVVQSNIIKVPTSGITNTQLAPNSVTDSNIVTATITGDKLAANTVTDSNIALATITGDRIASNTITAVNINTGSLNNATFVPVAAGITNVSGTPVIPEAWNFLRAVNGFTVIGRVTITVPSTTAGWQISITTPVQPNNFTNLGQAAGIGYSGLQVPVIAASVGNKVVTLSGGPSGTTTFTVTVHYTYVAP